MTKQNGNFYAPSARGKYIAVSLPFAHTHKYEQQLSKAAKRKRPRRRPTLPSYLEETHLGGLVERVPGFEMLNAMRDMSMFRNSKRDGLGASRDKYSMPQSPTSSQMQDLTPENVFGIEDDWTLITETSAIPWRAICHLEITYESERTATGTGWIAGPDTVITAGHNVLSREGDGWASRGIMVVPGRHNDGSNFIHPFGETYASGIDALEGWKLKQDPKFDLGVIKLANKHIGYRTGWFGATVFSDNDFIELPPLNTAGYPGTTKQHGTMWFDAGRILTPLTDNFIQYRLDTEAGQSGSPIFFWDRESGQRWVTAVHVYGAGFANLGLRINRNIFDTISNWIK